uniref:Uncharacterized protein n=1 Tax=Anguilla anguilla TaxID=7936 RepID=A0A0E9TU57_ANGAN
MRRCAHVNGWGTRNVLFTLSSYSAVTSRGQLLGQILICSKVFLLIQKNETLILWIIP